MDDDCCFLTHDSDLVTCEQSERDDKRDEKLIVAPIAYLPVMTPFGINGLLHVILMTFPAISDTMISCGGLDTKKKQVTC